MANRQKKDAAQPKKKAEVGEIEAKAYAIFLERQLVGAPGDHLSDWYEAERRLTEARGDHGAVTAGR